MALKIVKCSHKPCARDKEPVITNSFTHFIIACIKKNNNNNNTENTSYGGMTDTVSHVFICGQVALATFLDAPAKRQSENKKVMFFFNKKL